jgi:hypothetical protein
MIGESRFMLRGRLMAWQRMVHVTLGQIISSIPFWSMWSSSLGLATFLGMCMSQRAGWLMDVVVLVPRAAG